MKVKNVLKNAKLYNFLWLSKDFLRKYLVVPLDFLEPIILLHTQDLREPNEMQVQFNS